jgi:hypothetical protein
MQARREKLEAQRACRIEHRGDRVLRRQDVIVRQSYMIVLPPATPFVEELPKASPLWPRDDLSHGTVRVRLWRDFLERAKVEVPVSRFALVNPTPAQRVFAYTCQDQVPSHAILLPASSGHGWFLKQTQSSIVGGGRHFVMIPRDDGLTRTNLRYAGT